MLIARLKALFQTLRNFEIQRRKVDYFLTNAPDILFRMREAIEAGNPAALSLLFDSCPTLDTDFRGRLLLDAIKGNKLGCARILLKNGAPANFFDETKATFSNFSPLFAACVAKNLTAMELLLGAGANPNVQQAKTGATSLSLCLRITLEPTYVAGSVDYTGAHYLALERLDAAIVPMVTMLIRFGAEVTETLLTKAAEIELPLTYKALLKAALGIPENEELRKRNGARAVILEQSVFVALQHKNPGILTLLAQAGANFRARHPFRKHMVMDAEVPITPIFIAREECLANKALEVRAKRCLAAVEAVVGAGSIAPAAAPVVAAAAAAAAPAPAAPNEVLTPVAAAC